MQTFVYWGALAALMILLGWTVFSDLKARRIPNWLNAAVAILAFAYWGAQDVPFWKAMGVQIALAAGVAVIFGLLWLRGWMGGGDLKLQIALALWLPFIPLMEMLVWISIAGLFVTLIGWAEHRLRRRPGRVRIPYGVAIAVGAAIVLGEPIINRFSA
ncbi:A24 family peptidase [Pacificimonas sp. ICDLI1SI03]